MLTVKWTLVGVVVGYAGLLALMYVAQRSLMYFPEKARTPPAAAGLPEAQEIFLQTADGEKLIAWHVPPRGDIPIVMSLHSDSVALAFLARLLCALLVDGTMLPCP